MMQLSKKIYMKNSRVDGHNTANPISIGCIAIKVFSPKNRSIIFDDPVYDGTHTKVGRILEAHNNKPKNIKYKMEIQQKNSLSLFKHDRNITVVNNTYIYFS